jgi:hypothetical protein
MHPGPINRGVEIDSDLADSARSVISISHQLASRFVWASSSSARPHADSTHERKL